MIAWDLETAPISNSDPAPAPACLSWCGTSEVPRIAPSRGIEEVFSEILTQNELLLTVNGAYDIQCLLKHHPSTCKALLRYRQHIDLSLLQGCVWIEQGRPIGSVSLDNLCRSHGAALTVAKDPALRTSYGPLVGRPLSEFSADQIRYSKSDALATHQLGCALIKIASKGAIEQAKVLTRRQNWLQACSVEGLRTDPERVQELSISYHLKFLELLRLAKEGADPIVRASGVTDTKRLQALVAVAYDGNPPLTRKPRKASAKWRPSVSTTRETLEQSGDPRLIALAEYRETKTFISKDLELLKMPFLRPRYRLATTTRTTTSNPNTQNFGRDGKARSAIVPPPGEVILAADFTGLELVAGAQSAIDLFGDRSMADLINAGTDLHSLVGVEIFNEVNNTSLGYDDFLLLLEANFGPAKEFRGFGKIPTFGSMGGMTRVETLVLFARGLGIKMDERQAAIALACCRRVNPTIQRLLDWVQQRCPRNAKQRRLFDVPMPGTTLIRRACPAPAAANSLIQAPGAAIAGAAGSELYDSQIFGRLGELKCRMFNFIHDEWLFYVPEENVGHAAAEVERLMISGAATKAPDVRIQVSLTAMRRWDKKAHSKFDRKKERISIYVDPSD